MPAQEILTKTKGKEQEEIIPKEVKSMFSMMLQAGPVPPQILDKITSSHIDKVLDISEKSSMKDTESKNKARKYYFGAFLIIITAFLLLVYGLNKNPELLKDIMVIFASIVGGFGAGYGYCKYTLERD